MALIRVISVNLEATIDFANTTASELIPQPCLSLPYRSRQ
jgi:hypothetical protein